jgi:hypothetical protein
VKQIWEMEGDGGTDDASVSDDGGMVYSSLPNVASGDDDTPSSAQHRVLAPYPVQQRATPPLPSLAQQRATPPLPSPAQ